MGKGRCDEGGHDTPSALSGIGQGVTHEVEDGTSAKRRRAPSTRLP